MDGGDDGRRHEHIPSKNDLEKRRTRGSEVALQGRPVGDVEKGMSQADMDNLNAHRFGDVHQRRIGPISENGTVEYEPARKLDRVHREIDRTPHELFVELDELIHSGGDDYQWKQRARWIKFEEDVLEGADRWGKPHVASLSFHSMLELRKCLENGAVLLDLEESDLQSIVTATVDELINTSQLDSRHRADIISALMLRHVFTGETGGFLRRNSQAVLGLVDMEDGNPESHLQGFKGKKYRFSEPYIAFNPKHKKSTEDKAYIVNGSRGAVNGGYEQHGDMINISPRYKHSIGVNNAPAIVDMDLLKKIPKGAQVTSVLVGTVDYIDKPVMAFVRLSRGRYLNNFTQVPLPIRFIIVLLGPPTTSIDYPDVGRSISTLMSNQKFKEVAFEARDRSEMLHALNEFLDDSLVLPPGELDKKTLMPVLNMAKEKTRLRKRRRKEKEELIKAKEMEAEAEPPEDPLARTGRPFGGMINDLKHRIPMYWSDIKDGLNMQCLSVVIFIYFAALSPAITFGGLLSDKVDKWIGVSEMLAGVAFMGIIFHLFAAQPLLIIGFTGPLLVFEEGLYNLSDSVGLEYISFRVWIGIWLSVITAIVIMFEGSFLVRLVTRFTEEVFAALISLIFIIEVFIKLASIFDDHPLSRDYDSSVECYNESAYMTTQSMVDNMTTMAPDSDSSSSSSEERKDEPNTALLSLILCLATFSIAYFLKSFRNSKYLGRTARRSLGDFGVPIAIFIMVMVDVLIRPVYTEKLDVPDGLQTTSDDRGWFINPMGEEEDLPVWGIFAAIIPALLVFILIFMETMITNIIVNKKLMPENKGPGYHWSMMLIGLFGAVTGILGLPFLTAATVRSVTHTNACQVWSTSHAPGDKAKLQEVKEQRVTGIFVHIFIGASVLMGPLLRKIPLAVLFGVFLYMGVASMGGVQLFDRFYLLFKPVKYHPDIGYVKKVRTLRMHSYTFIQVICLGVLWAVKSTQAALGFPFILILLVPIRRYLLPKIYTETELEELDSDDHKPKEGPLEYDSDEDDDIFKEIHMPI